MLTRVARALLGTRRLGNLLRLWARWVRGGLPPGQIVQGLRQTYAGTLEALLVRDLQRAVDAGRPMVSGLRAWLPATTYLALVSASESQHFGARLASCAEQLREGSGRTGAILASLTHGLVLLGTAAFVMVAVVDARLAPVIADIASPATLPPQTLRLLAVSGHLAQHWYAWLLALALPLATLVLLAGNFPRLLLPAMPHLPLLRLWHRWVCAQLLHSLALLAESGMRSWSGAATDLEPNCAPLQLLLLRSFRANLAKGYTPGACLGRLSGLSARARWELRQAAGEADLAALVGQIADEEMQSVHAALQRAAQLGRALCSVLAGLALLLIFGGIWGLTQSLSLAGAS